LKQFNELRYKEFTYNTFFAAFYPAGFCSDAIWVAAFRQVGFWLRDFVRTPLGTKPRFWFHLIFGLSLLPYSEVDDCFVEDLMSIKPLSEKLIEFSDYLVDTSYISSSSTFPPSL